MRSLNATTLPPGLIGSLVYSQNSLLAENGGENTILVGGSGDKSVVLTDEVGDFVYAGGERSLITDKGGFENTLYGGGTGENTFRLAGTFNETIYTGLGRSMVFIGENNEGATLNIQGDTTVVFGAGANPNDTSIFMHGGSLSEIVLAQAPVNPVGAGFGIINTVPSVPGILPSAAYTGVDPVASPNAMPVMAEAKG